MNVPLEKTILRVLTISMDIRLKPNSFYRYHLLLPFFLSCTCWNMIRRTLGEAAPRLIDSSFFTQSNYAMLNTVAFIVYGLSKFFSCQIIRGNLFKIYTIFFAITGFLCVLCGVLCSQSGSSFVCFALIWIVNYMFMGALWPIICIVFKQMLPDNLRGIYWSVVCCCSSIGTILCNSISLFYGGTPSTTYYCVGAIVITTSIISYAQFPKVPESDVEYHPVNKSKESIKVNRGISVKEITSISLLLFSVFIVENIIFFNNQSTMNQRIICDWGLLLFPEVLNNDFLKIRHSASAVSFIEIGGIFGTLWCGWISDAFHVSRIRLCEISSVLAGILFYALPLSSSIISFYIISFILGFFVYIPFSFSELIAIEGVDSKYSSFIISMNGLVAPFGSVFSGMPVDMIIKRYGWKVLPSLLCFSFFSFTLFLLANSYIRRGVRDSKDILYVC